VREPVYLDNFAVDPIDGTLYLADSVTNTIYHSNPATQVVIPLTATSPLGFAGGLSIVASPQPSLFFQNNDVVYLADTYSLRSFSLNDPVNTDNAFVRAGEFGQDFQFGTFNVLATATTLFISSSYEPQIQVRSRNPNMSILDINAGLGFPYGIAQLSDSSLVVADFFTGLLLYTGASFQTQTNIPTPGFSSLIGLALVPGQSSSVYFSDYNTGSIVSVNVVTGHLTVIISGLSQPEGIAVSNDGNFIIVAEVGKQRIISLSVAYPHVVIPLASELNIGLGGGFPNPGPNIMTGVAVSPSSGQIYFTSDIDNAIYSI